MKIIALPRQGGKTHRLIELAIEHDAYIVCSSLRGADQISQIAPRSLRHPITHEEFISGQFCGRGAGAFVIDDVDMLLARLGRGVPVLAATITEEPAEAGGED